MLSYQGIAALGRLGLSLYASLNQPIDLDNISSYCKVLKIYYYKLSKTKAY